MKEKKTKFQWKVFLPLIIFLFPVGIIYAIVTATTKVDAPPKSGFTTKLIFAGIAFVTTFYFCFTGLVFYMLVPALLSAAMIVLTVIGQRKPNLRTLFSILYTVFFVIVWAAIPMTGWLYLLPVLIATPFGVVGIFLSLRYPSAMAKWEATSVQADAPVEETAAAEDAAE